MEFSQIKNELSKQLGDKFPFFFSKLENCQSINDLLDWVHLYCNSLGAAGVFNSAFLLSLFTQAQLDGVQVFVREPGQGVLMPEKLKVQGFYYVFGGNVVQQSHNLHGAFFEGTVAEVRAGHATYFADTSGTLNGPSVGHVFRNARVTVLGGASAHFFNEATGVGKEHSHIVCMGCSSVELFDKANGLAMEQSKMTFNQESTGRAMGNSVCLCQDKSSVMFDEKAQGLILSAGRISVNGTNTLYKLSSKSTITANKTSQLVPVAAKEVDGYVARFKAYVPALGKRLDWDSERG